MRVSVVVGYREFSFVYLCWGCPSSHRCFPVSVVVVGSQESSSRLVLHLQPDLGFELKQIILLYYQGHFVESR